MAIGSIQLLEEGVPRFRRSVMGVYAGLGPDVRGWRHPEYFRSAHADRQIDEFKEALRELGILVPEHLSALCRLATIESIGSSWCIEGSKLSDRDVERLLANPEIKSFVIYAEVVPTTLFDYYTP